MHKYMSSSLHTVLGTSLNHAVFACESLFVVLIRPSVLSLLVGM